VNNTSAIKRGWDVFYKSINMVRWVISNVVFFGIVGLVLLLGAFFAVILFQTPTLNPRTTLVLNLEGNVVEQYTANSMGRAVKQLVGNSNIPEQRLFDIVAAIGFAKTDPNITQLVIKTDGLNQMGVAQAREVVRAIQSFKKSQKPVIAVGQNFTQKQYLIASAADQIFMDPEGHVQLEGLAQYRQYYREALQDKLGITVELFKVGKFKSAAEPYVLDAASPQSKEADLYWMNDVWNRYLSDIAHNRKINIETVKEMITRYQQDVMEAHGDLAQIALKNQLVDGLLTFEQVKKLLEKNGSHNPLNAKLETISTDNYFQLVHHFLNQGKEKVAIVVAEGEIVDGTGSPSEVGGESTAKVLSDIREDENVKAVVLRVNSPGGAVFASEQIRREVELLQKTGRPVVVSMGDTAASGGYWISMNANKILADPSTITGSIGIFGMVPNVSKALEKIGVRTDGVSTTEQAGNNDITRPMSSSARAVLQSVIENGYTKFTTKVAKYRNLPLMNVEENAQGRVWSGQQALERRLVDQMGGLQDAIVEAKNIAGLKNGAYSIVVVETESGGMGSWLMGVAQNKWLAHIGQEMGVWAALAPYAPPQTQKEFKVLSTALKKKGSPTIMAHCLCELEEAQ